MVLLSVEVLDFTGCFCWGPSRNVVGMEGTVPKKNHRNSPLFSRDSEDSESQG